MADNISELSTSPQIENHSSSGKWAFLRKVFRRKPSASPLPQAQTLQVKQTETPRSSAQIPQNSGLEQLIKQLQSGSERITAHRITLLYPDFLKYLNEDLKHKYAKDPKTMAKIMERLNAGDYEVIEMFARVMEAKYAGDINHKRTAQIESRRIIPSTDRSGAELLGLKKAEARLLAYEMYNKTAQAEKRQSRAGLASGLADWKIILSKPKHEVDWNKELAKIPVAFPGEVVSQK